jgi:ubiquinone/menaquinone biosynthesis C-methylase UbiE
MKKAEERAEMPVGSSPVLEYRSLEKDYNSLIPVISPGMRILDVGCGPGAISSGIAALVGEKGRVTGIDNSSHLIERGKQLYAGIGNLELVHADLFSYNPGLTFDLIIAARVLQWLSNPREALAKIQSLLKPGGMVSILDYNHTTIEWQPEPPGAMKQFYQAFLKWRADAGMNNRIAADLPGYFKELGFEAIETIDANETYTRGEPDFLPKIGIWTKVAETRGRQMVEEGYISENERRRTIDEYEHWISAESRTMVMKLTEVRGIKRGSVASEK